MILGITGMPLSGKTLAAEILEEEGFAVLDMGEVVRIEMDKRGVEPKKTGPFVNEMRSEHGMDAIAQLSVPYLKEVLEEKERIVITGMRSWEEKRRFQKEIEEEIEVVAIWSSRETRRKRREERQRDEDIKGDGFKERDEREIENGVGKMIALSDHLIKNQATVEELEQKVKEVV
jgi:dephospho-CoA kinase